MHLVQLSNTLSYPKVGQHSKANFNTKGLGTPFKRRTCIQLDQKQSYEIILVCLRLRASLKCTVYS